NSSSSSSSDSEPELTFKVNEAFAEKYEAKKRGEELSKLQDKYGKDYQLGDEDEDDETDYSTDDEDAELVTPEVDAAILRTLAKIRAKDPSVYEEGRAVFDEEEAETAAARRAAASGSKSARQKASKPVLLKDFQRARLLANAQGDDDAAAPSANAEAALTPVEEQRLLKQEMKAAFLGAASDSDDEDEAGGLFKKREKGDDERAREEQDYEKFLESAVGKKAVKAALGDEEAFLRDYILNRGWIDREDEAHHIPSYEEIVGGDDGASQSKSSKKCKAKSKLLEDDDEVRDEEGHVLNPGLRDSDDDEIDEEAEEFEHRYNFRFEQDGAADLVTHSRTVGSTSVRKPTTAVSARARAREAAKERKEAEKLQRKEELRRLKALKRKEVEERLEKLLEAAGKGTKNLEEIDLDGEWDEKKHEEAMKKVYDEEYEGLEDEDFKPTWDDDIDIADIVGDEDGSDADEDAEAHLPFASTSALPVEGEDGEDALMAPPSKKAKKDKKGKKGKRGDGDDDGLPTELIETVKAQGDSEAAQLADKLVDEYYALDYEDKVGDVKTRFHYAKVPAESFNLTPEEILLATDAELNSYMSLKKLAPYRQDSAAYRSKQAQKQRKKLKELRDMIRNRKWGEEVDEAQAIEALEKRKEKKRRYKENAEKRKMDELRTEHGGDNGAAGDADGEPPKKKVKRAGKSERKRKQKEQAA
ncbi:Krr1-domain-containing protein, partial [Rhodotorula sp. JG-1b]